MTEVICCIVIGTVLYFCVHDVCETILEVHKPAEVKDDFFNIQNDLDEASKKESLPTFDDVLRSVNNLLGGDDDE